MSIEQNKVVTFDYTLKDDEGNILDTTEGASPFSFLSGKGQILPKLEDEINTMIIGSKKQVKIAASDAYGEYNEQAVQQVERSNFPAETELKPGMQFVANSPEGKQMPFIVSEVMENDVKIDFNHPLAGKNLEFDVKLIDIREPTPEELAHGHSHEQGGHQH